MCFRVCPHLAEKWKVKHQHGMDLVRRAEEFRNLPKVERDLLSTSYKPSFHEVIDKLIGELGCKILLCIFECFVEHFVTVHYFFLWLESKIGA